ncbi:MAG: methionine biosynthesis protein MetW [Alphaproteobacteria bacterium]|nr:methionine biosynthesis protein MetW [Alphaproteobacteria bacterium]
MLDRTKPSRSARQHHQHRVDHLLIAEMVAPGSRVLDVGCGDGALLQLLADTKAVDGRGVELSREKVNACVARGLSVIQGDADQDLDDYPDQAFDYAVLSLTIQATQRPRDVLVNLLRIGHRAIVSFPNFGHWMIRAELLFNGRMPQTANLPEPWYSSPDSHLCTIRDFVELCDVLDTVVEEAVAFNSAGRRLPIKKSLTLQNLLGEKAVFKLRRRKHV